MARLIDIEGIGSFHVGNLEAVGISTQEQLLTAAATPAGRQGLCEKCELTMDQVLNWANRADLARVSGITNDYADLLEAAGVDTVPELAQRNPENLCGKLEEVNEVHIMVDEVPSYDSVTRWVAEAKSLPRALKY